MSDRMVWHHTFSQALDGAKPLAGESLKTIMLVDGAWK